MYRPSIVLIAFASAGLVAVAACSGSDDRSGFGSSGSSGDNTSSGSSGNASSSGSLGTSSGGTSSGDGGTACVPNPNNAEIPNNNCDDDDDGKVDNVKTCDSSSTGADPTDFAASMGICDSVTTTTGKWGLVSATFTQGYNRTDAPNAAQHSALATFGSVLVPREGARLGILSTGYAEPYDSAGGTKQTAFNPGKDWNDAEFNPGNGTAPPGFPKAANGCATSNDVNDVANIHLVLTAPPNATGFQFDFNFHSGEWPQYICSMYNDSFVAYLSAKGFNSGTPGNMSFDPSNNPVSVNNNFFDRCTPGAETGCAPGSKEGTSTCAGGPGELAGTGFGIMDDYCQTGTQTVGGGATGWLTSKAAVTPGETFTIDLMVWDTGDGSLDSLVLLDNFQWIGGAPVTTVTTRVN